MDLGLVLFPTDASVDPVTLGKAAEEAGFESLFFPEHTHIPVSRATPYPGGGPLPDEYRRTHDPFVSLAMVAATTERLQVGTGICLVVERDPIVTAKAVASLQRLSGGRFLFGIGAGWNAEEMANHGTDPSVRFGVMRERVAAMRAIWTSEEAEFHGEHVDFDPIWCWPKPGHHVSVLVGGVGATALDRVVDYGDEWFPINLGDDVALAARIDDLQSRARAAGRDPLGVTLYGAPRSEEGLAKLAQAGVTRAVFILPPEEEAATLDRVRRYAGFVGAA